MARLLIGLALMPSSALTLAVVVQALGLLAARESSAVPFLAGLGFSALLWTAGRCGALDGSGAASRLGSLARRIYVFGHEMTHAIAAWSVGAKVLGFKVGEGGGHVDLSHSNAFVSLAPYCLPIYTLLTVAGYRILLWSRPGVSGQTAFLVLLGLTLSFHWIKTFECLWDHRQPDLSDAGGAVFSLACIAMANALVILVLIKALFPGAVSLSGVLLKSARLSRDFWVCLAHGAYPLAQALRSRLSR